MKVPIQDEPTNPKVKVEKGSASQGGKSTCATFGQKQFGKCLAGTRNCFCFGKEGHKGGIVLLWRLEEEWISKFLQVFSVIMFQGRIILRSPG